MICNFKQTEKEWVCSSCGRRVKRKKSQEFMPTAKCRIPENYKFKSRYIYNKKIKGVGDTISGIIKQIGYNYNPVGSGMSKITYLNKKGIDWCDKNQHLIYNWFKEECYLQGVVLLEKTARSIVRLAIIKAKNQDISL